MSDGGGPLGQRRGEGEGRGEGKAETPLSEHKLYLGRFLPQEVRIFC